MKIQHNQDNDILLPNIINDIKPKKTEYIDDKINKNYLRIDRDYNLRAVNKEYIKEKNDNIIISKENYNNINHIVIKILEKINCPYEDIFNYSLNLCKKLVVNKKDVELSYDIFYQINKNIDVRELYFNKKILITIGILLNYSYTHFYKYKIKNLEKLEKAIAKIREKNIDIFTDYFLWCHTQNIVPEKNKISLYIKNTKKKYEIPPATLILLNVYQNITTIILEIDKLDYPDLIQNDYKFFELSILNLHWMLKSILNIKFNFISQRLLLSFFSTYRQRYKSIYSKLNSIIKPINITFDDKKSFNQKWDFSYKLKLYNNIKKDKEVAQIDKNLLLNEKKEMQIAYIDIIARNKHLLEFIFISFFSLNLYNNENINFELIINDCYIGEFNRLFDGIYKLNFLNNNHLIFNLMDLLLFNNIINHINKINIEINCLDNNTFKKLSSFLYYNDLITNLNISLFSTDVSFIPELLFKTYCDMFNSIESSRKELKKNYNKNTYLFSENKEIEDKIIDNLYLKIVDSLSSFFECIKSKKNLKELGFNIEAPYIIRKKANYMNTIFKFILNILYFVSNQKIEKFCLISPYTVISPITKPNINNLISSINFHNNKYYKELTLQMQFYQSSSIISFLNSRLRILNIGNLDLSTFKVLCDYMSKYNFCKNSSLQNLTIGLLGYITEFNNEIKELFGKLFRIKINSLISLSLLTEIHLKNEKQYIDILDLINFNWISKYIIKFDDNSKDIYEKEKKKIINLESLTSHFLEKELEKKGNNILKKIKEI